MCTHYGVNAVTDELRSFVNVQVISHLGNSVFQGNLQCEVFLCIAGSHAGFQLCFGSSGSPKYVTCVFFNTHTIALLCNFRRFSPEMTSGLLRGCWLLCTVSSPDFLCFRTTRHDLPLLNGCVDTSYTALPRRQVQPVVVAASWTCH